MADDRIPMTREGYDNLKAELAKLEHEMLEVTKRVAAARDLGDLSENAEYHAAREDQGMVDAKIRQVKDQLTRAVIIENSNVPEDTVAFGRRVTVMDLDANEEEVYELVSPGKDDPMNNKILVSSPIGVGLVGKRIGDTVEIPVPRGSLRYRIVGVSVLK